MKKVIGLASFATRIPLLLPLHLPLLPLRCPRPSSRPHPRVHHRVNQQNHLQRDAEPVQGPLQGPNPSQGSARGEPLQALPAIDDDDDLTYCLSHRRRSHGLHAGIPMSRAAALVTDARSLSASLT
ncbi:hypothetical protein ACFX1Q_000196 [Malus domestica]